MAKNREPEEIVESETESGEEEEASSEDVETDSDSEPERQTQTQNLNQIAKKTPPAAAPRKSEPAAGKPPPPASSSEGEDDEEEETGSESDSDSDRTPNVKPLSSKPMDELQKSTVASKAPRSKPSGSGLTSPVKSAAVKRPAAAEKENEAKESKRAKKKPELEPESSDKKSNVSNDDSKKQLFQRLWSEDDEIVLLKGMLDYVAKKKADPVADLNAFHDFIKRNLHVEVSRTQLQDKIRRLKKKYENNKGKEKEGKERTFSKAHEQKAYELSKKIWGNESGNDNENEKVFVSPKANGNGGRRTPNKRAKVENEDGKEVKTSEGSSGNVDLGLPRDMGTIGGGFPDWLSRMGEELLEGDVKHDFAQQWKALKLQETELFIENLDLMKAKAKLILDAWKPSGH